ncbi:recombinase family protein [Paenibacillus cymbidii]|uniref:recombinase family protein n=1 Tax=Paenibacillus cymbidii TaxID=1639034 RepID=UPI0010801F24|nr:recombinase family protein [Paenibacillus cymbidii]
MLMKHLPSYGMALYVQEDRRGEEQVDSLLAQLQMLRTEAKCRGIINGVYVDTCPVTSSYCDRPGLSKLIADMRREQFDAILVTGIWRLFRNAEVGYELSELITAAGKHLISLDGLVDTMSGNSALLDHYNWIHFQRLMDKSK